MDTLDLMSILEKTGFSGSMLCQSSLGISPDRIRENVILSPSWPPEKLEHLGKPVQIVSSGPLYGYAVWDICLDGLTVTLLKTGFGAPVVLDAMLVLRSTPCKRVLFVSSVGGLGEKMQVGDLVVPVSSMSGDGASRYINPNGLAEDRMGRKAFPDPAFLQLVQEETERICREEGVAWHEGEPFCTDTILAQFAHLDEIRARGCNTLDMESAVAFEAGRMLGLPIAALLNVSDNVLHKKPALQGECQQQDAQRGRFVRGQVMPRIIEAVFRRASL